MRNLIAWILAFGLAANGVFMLAAPETWYHFIPTVPVIPTVAEGPLVTHNPSPAPLTIPSTGMGNPPVVALAPATLLRS